jgi:hypothetical protein
MGVGERLRRLDDRVLRLDRRAAELRTEQGWRRYAARWRWMAGLAVVLLATPFVAGLFDQVSLTSLIPLGGIVAFQAGAMKAEDDRLHRRGPVEQLRPPGL